VNWDAVLLTGRLALLTAGILTVAGVPLAWWLASTRWRWKPFIEAVVTLPLVLPPTVLGFYLLVALGPSSPLGRAYESLTGGRLSFSFEGLVVASVLYSLPFAVQPFTAALAGIDPRLVEASLTVGAGPWTTLRRVVAPLATPGLITGVVMSFAHTVGEFGVVLMVGGNIPGVTRTLSIDVYDQVQTLHYEAAGQTALFLLAVSYLMLLAVHTVNRAAARPGGLSGWWAGR
jgi:molybdate transport system permease protein